METVVKKAWNPDIELEYEVKLPAPHFVEAALLEIDFPLNGLHRNKITEILADRFSLTDEQRNARNRVNQRVFNVLVGYVASALVKSGEAVAPKSMWININSGQASGQSKTIKNDCDNSGGRPEKLVEENYQKIRDELAAELLQKIKDNTPAFFEELVIDLLVKMGYGGSREDAQAVGRSGDGGIDGIINEDRLGLDAIYVQAKRWDEGNVGEPDIARFAGALAKKGANKGVFITTSDFTRDAKAYDAAGFKIILIDGNQLAQLMIDHDVGVSTTKTYEIKRVDSDYFAENAENP